MSPSARRQRLLGAPSAAAFAGAALAGLAALFLRAGHDPRRWLAAPGPDPLAVAYLRALVDRHPADAAARCRLARAQLALGQPREAERTLAPLLGDGASGEAALLSAEVAVAAWRAAPAGSPERAAASDEAAARLQRLLGGSRGPQELDHLAGAARELGRPDLAAQAHLRAAELDGQGCARWLSEAGRDSLAAGEPRSAGDAYARASDCGGAEAVALGLRALEAYRAAGAGGEALRLADRLVDRFPEEPLLLRTAEAIALEQDDRERARRYGDRLMAAGSADAVSLGRQLDLELAAGDLGGALRAAERLAALAPEDLRARATAARVATWAGRPGVALRHRMWLWRHGVRDDLDQALGLARAVGDWGALAELLAGRSREAALPAASLAELAEALENAGSPGRAAAALGDYARRHPASQDAWEALAAAQERSHDLAAALATRSAAAARFGASPDRSVGLARLDWALGRPGAALAELERWSGSADPGDVGYWELLAALAWDREADDTALRAYRTLWQAGHVDAAGAERLLLLSGGAGRSEAVIRYGREGWARLGQPRLLLLAMDEAARAGRWGDLELMGAEAAGAGDAFAGFPAYWMLRARLEERAGRIPAALEAYRRALAADPASAAARSGVIWLLASAHDRVALSRCLAAWSADAWNDPALWRAYAAGLWELGRRREALAFHEREVRAGPDDAEAVRRLAAALRRTGDAPAAATLEASLSARPAAPGTPIPAAPELAGAGSGRIRSLAAAAGAEVRAEAMGPVTVRQLRAAARSEALGAEVGARAAVTAFGSGNPGLRLPGEETEVLIGASFQALGGRNELAGGISLRADGDLPRAELAHARALGPMAQARLEASLGEPADESAAFRVEATRTRLGGALSLAGGPLYGRGGLDWKRWSRRAGGALGTGAAATAEVGWLAQAPGADVRVRLQGGYQRNWAAAGPAAEALAAFAPGSAILPRQLAALGLGAGAERWAVGPARLLADGWAGWTWPPARPAFRVRVGISVAPFRDGDLSLTAFAGNDRWARGGNYGASVAFAQSFPR